MPGGHGTNTDSSSSSSSSSSDSDCDCDITCPPPVVNVAAPIVNVNYDPPEITVEAPVVNVTANGCGFICHDRLPVLVCRIRETGPIESTRGMTFRARSKKEWEWGFSLNDGTRWGIHATLVYDALIEPIRN